MARDRKFETFNVQPFGIDVEVRYDSYHNFFSAKVFEEDIQDTDIRELKRKIQDHIDRIHVVDFVPTITASISFGRSYNDETELSLGYEKLYLGRTKEREHGLKQVNCHGPGRALCPARRRWRRRWRWISSFLIARAGMAVSRAWCSAASPWDVRFSRISRHSCDRPVPLCPMGNWRVWHGSCRGRGIR